jgi:sugar lactone lactonase YvrE
MSKVECVCAVGAQLGEGPLWSARIEKPDAYPDGPAVDCSGCVWIGLYGGWGRAALAGGLFRRTGGHRGLASNEVRYDS